MVKVHDLLISQLSNFVLIVRPGELSVLEVFIELAISIKSLETVPPTYGEGIKMEALLSKQINPTEHVDLAANNEHTT